MRPLCSPSGLADPETQRFDEIIAALQEVVIGESFQAAQNGFFAAHCGHFEASEDNKLVYTEIFQKYQASLETLLAAQLKAKVPGFSMEEFAAMLETRHSLVDPELLELLVSFSEFPTFKETMLGRPLTHTAYKFDKTEEEKEGPMGLTVKKSVIHSEEQEDGEERPDLQLDIVPLTSPDKRLSKTAKKPEGKTLEIKAVRMKPGGTGGAL